VDYHSFLIKSAVGKDRPAIWKLLRALSVKPGLPPIPGGKPTLKKSIVLKAPALAYAKEAPSGISKQAISITKEAVRGMLRSKIRFMPQTPEFAAALPKATEAVSAARGYLQSMASANLDPGMLNKMNQQQRDKYLQMILGRGNAAQPMQKVRSILPSLPKDLKGLLM